MTTKLKSPSLRLLLGELRGAAERCGKDRSLQLSHGARVAWRVRDGRATFAVSRKEKQLGDTELVTFKAQANVPPGAVRVPSEGQMPVGVGGETWWRVGWVWSCSDNK